MKDFDRGQRSTLISSTSNVYVYFVENNSYSASRSFLVERSQVSPRISVFVLYSRNSLDDKPLFSSSPPIILQLYGFVTIQCNNTPVDMLSWSYIYGRTHGWYKVRSRASFSQELRRQESCLNLRCTNCEQSKTPAVSRALFSRCIEYHASPSGKVKILAHELKAWKYPALIRGDHRHKCAIRAFFFKVIKSCIYRLGFLVRLVWYNCIDI